MADFTLTVTYTVTMEFKAKNEEEADELAQEITDELDVRVSAPSGELRPKIRKAIAEAEVEFDDYSCQEN